MSSFNKSVVSHYGIHVAAGNVAFLEQQRGGTNALGLREKSPFTVHLSKRGAQCNHLIPLAAPNPDAAHLDFIERICKDPLFQAMLPIPKHGAGVYYLTDESDGLSLYLSILSKMSSPIKSVVVPVWMMNPAQIQEELHMTNVQPLVLTQFEAKHTELLTQLAKGASYAPRTLIMTGSGDVPLPPNVQRITTELNQFKVEDMMTLPWESIGAVIVRKHMRGEWDPKENWMTSRPTPATEKKAPRPMPHHKR